MLGGVIPQYTATYFATTTTSSHPFNTSPAPRTIDSINVHVSREKFSFGNCASIAICQAFDVPYNAFKAICKATKIKSYDDMGLLFSECKKLINLLSSSCQCTSDYIPNKGKITYVQMLLLLNEGKYLVMFDEHLSFSENGEVYDSFFYYLPIDFKQAKPTGWWKINT